MKRKYILIYSAFFILLSSVGPSASAQNTKGVDKGITAFINATIYPSPTDSSIQNGTLLTENGRIVFVGKQSEARIPPGANLIDCKGLTITAGFWNSHVHFTDAKIANAKELSTDSLSDYLKGFLTKYGFTTVFDIGSIAENTKTIRQRIENGSLPGPQILTTGLPLVPEHGTPFYVKALNITLPEISSADMATKMVNQYLSSGMDAIKIFAGSPVEPGTEKIMPLQIAKAITSAAHKQNRLVFAHPSVNEAIQVAIGSGVDILAHTTPDGGKAWDSVLVRRMIAGNMYLIPTLKLWKWSLQNNKQSQEAINAFVAVALEQVKAYKTAGGNILFGTDAGFMNDFDPTDEYVLLQQAGLNFREILATLTTTPSDKFGFANQAGKIVIGMNADLAIFSGDPQADIRVLANVKYTVRKGKIIYKEHD